MRVYKLGFAKSEEDSDFFIYKKIKDKEAEDDKVFYEVIKNKYLLKHKEQSEFMVKGEENLVSSANEFYDEDEISSNSFPPKEAPKEILLEWKKMTDDMDPFDLFLLEEKAKAEKMNQDNGLLPNQESLLYRENNLAYKVQDYIRLYEDIVFQIEHPVFPTADDETATGQIKNTFSLMAKHLKSTI